MNQEAPFFTCCQLPLTFWDSGAKTAFYTKDERTIGIICTRFFDVWVHVDLDSGRVVDKAPYSTGHFSRLLGTSPPLAITDDFSEAVTVFDLVENRLLFRMKSMDAFGIIAYEQIESNQLFPLRIVSILDSNVKYWLIAESCSILESCLEPIFEIKLPLRVYSAQLINGILLLNSGSDGSLFDLGTMKRIAIAAGLNVEGLIKVCGRDLIVFTKDAVTIVNFATKDSPCRALFLN